MVGSAVVGLAVVGLAVVGLTVVGLAAAVVSIGLSLPAVILTMPTSEHSHTAYDRESMSRTSD